MADVPNRGTMEETMTIVAEGPSIVPDAAGSLHQVYTRPEHGTGSFADKCRFIVGLVTFVLALVLAALVGTYPRALLVAGLLYFAL